MPFPTETAVGIDHWESFKELFFHDPGLNISLDVSRVGFDGDEFARRRAEFARAFDAMAALEGGAIANPDERRQVGHYWLRDASLAPSPEQREAITKTLESIVAFAGDVHSGRLRPAAAPRFTQVLAVGIGGSALGPQFVSEALGATRPPLGIAFFDNTDPDGFDRVVERLGDELASTLVIVTSKSGSTPETRNGMLEIQRRFSERGLEFAQNAVAITGEGSELDRTAQTERWLARFPMWDWVGGRTSEMSAVGILPAALQGIDVRAFLAGAAAMDRLTRRTDLARNPAALLALSWLHATNGQGERDMVVLPYKDRLALFSRYLQQLVMESLGKEKDLNGRTVFQGIAVYGNKGSTDQHAYVQQLRDGVPNFFVTFIEVLSDRTGPVVEIEPDITAGDYLAGFLQGTRQALSERQRPNLTVTLPSVTPESVGALIALFERAVGYYATLVNVNAYHQPGVEAGKKAAAGVLSLQKSLLAALREAQSPLTVDDLADRIHAPDREGVYLTLRHLAANRDEVRSEGDPGAPGTQRWAWVD